MKKSKLLLNTLAKFFAGIILVGTLLFLPAGTFNYFNGWLFMLLLFVPMMILGIVLFFKAPDLLAKRLSSKEKEKTQQGVVKFSALIFLLGFVIAALDFKFGWSKVPLWIVIVASVILVKAYTAIASITIK